MNKGLSIFKKHQRFQGGTDEVRGKEQPFFKNGQWWWEKEPGLRPMSQMPDNEEDLSPEELRREQEDYKRRVSESKYIQAQRGSSNVPLSIFKRAQHLQGGEGSVNDPVYDVTPPAGFNEWLDSHQYNPQTNAVNPNLFYGYGDPSGSGGPGSYPPSGYTPPINIPFVPPGEYNFGSSPSYITDQQMIDQLGFDPGNPRNDLTRGFGSGVPTQRGVGYAANIAGNMVFPGLGMATGPAASWLTRWIQSLFGQHNVQNATQSSQTGQQPTQSTDTSGGDDTTDATGSKTTDVSAPSNTKPPTAGVGIDPWGNPAKPGEWWSPDFGRWTGEDQFGTTPGNYNLQGPGGWAIGARGTGFGEHVLGNPGSAIGWETLGGGGGHVNPNAWGGVRNEAGTARGGQTFASHQLNQIGKGIFSNNPNPEGLGPLYALTGTQSPSAGQFQQSQQQLQGILQANPSLMSGPTSGPMLRGGSRIPLETVQTGSSDIGLKIFKKHQKLQGGTEAVPSELPTPPYEGENYAGKGLKWLANDVRQGVLPDEDLDEIKRDPTSMRSLAAYAGAALSVGTLLSGGEGGKLPKGEPARIAGVAIQNAKTGKIYTGTDHPNIYYGLPEGAFKGVEGEPISMMGEGWNSPDGLIDGFVDQHGKFYDREEAWHQAQKAKQYTPNYASEGQLEATEFQRQQRDKAKPDADGTVSGGETVEPKYARGSSDIQHNPGLRLFMAGQGLRRKKPKK